MPEIKSKSTTYKMIRAALHQLPQKYQSISTLLAKKLSITVLLVSSSLKATIAFIASSFWSAFCFVLLSIQSKFNRLFLNTFLMDLTISFALGFKLGWAYFLTYMLEIAPIKPRLYIANINLFIYLPKPNPGV